MDSIPSCSAEVLVTGGTQPPLGINWCWIPTSTRTFATSDLDILVQNAEGVRNDLHYQSLDTNIRSL